MPGINGPTSLAAIRNADDDLARIRAALGELGLLDTTDIIVVADHGFSTISKESQTSSTVKTKFADTPEGRLPLGFVALDLAHALDLPLIDPDDNYEPIADGEHSKFGNGLIGGDKQQAQSRRGGEWRLGPDLSARRRQGDGQAGRRRAAGAGLRQRHFRRCEARQIPRHAARSTTLRSKAPR